MEEKKTEAQPQDQAQPETKSATFKYALGVIFFILGILAVFGWWSDLMTLIKGAIGIILILAGVITFAIAKE